jgi:hypothetical protein
MGVTVTTIITPDQTPAPIERPTYTDPESGIDYSIDDEGKFISRGYAGRSLADLVRGITRDVEEAAEKEAAAAKRAKLATVVDSDTTYVILGKRTIASKGLTGVEAGQPIRAKVRAKAARGGWNVTLADSGQKLTGEQVYDFSEDQLRLLAEHNLDVTRLQFTLDSERAKVRDTVSDPEVRVESTGPDTWKVSTFYYVEEDGTLTTYRPRKKNGYGHVDNPEVETAGVHDVTFDPATATFSSDGLTADSLWALKRQLAAVDNADNGKLVLLDLSEPGELVPFVSDPDTYRGSGDVVLEGFDHDRYLTALRNIEAVSDERRELLSGAIVGDPVLDGEEAE